MRRSAISAAATILVLALAAAAIGSFGFYAHALLLKYPPVWPDEALFANPALNLIRRGALSMDVYSGALPGIAQHTYFMPPLYYFYLAGFFYVGGPGVVVMRLSSLVAAMAVMMLTYSVALRSGLGRRLSLIPVCLLAVNTAFLRAALIGRMEMLTLAFILAALWLAMGRTGSEDCLGTKRSLLTGLACALAGLTHPFGAVAAIAVMGVRAVIPGGPRRKVLPSMLAGTLLPVAAWAAYILQDWRSFVAQFGAQAMAKLSHHASRPSGPVSSAAAAHGLGYVLHVVLADVAQFGPELRKPDEVMFLLAVTGGLAGLGLAALNRRALLVLLACQPMIVVLAVLGREMWYPAYLVPLTAVGLGHLIHLAKQRIPWRVACATAAVLLCAWFGLRSLRVTSKINYERNVVYKDGTNYTAWCAGISRALPSNSRVLISSVPDPYFCLAGRQDLALREFLHESVPIDPQQYRQYMADADYVVTGPDQKNLMTENQSPSPTVDAFVRSSGKLVTVVGTSSSQGYFARIYTVTKRFQAVAHETP